MPDPRIVRAAIHPAIGIARVGDSPEEYFIGPEDPNRHPSPDGGFRDAEGRLKRQAARFRIWGCDAAGNPVRELLPGDGTDVEWRVQVANTKAAWYEFELAMDIPEAVPASRRNPSIQGDQRAGLAIRPGARSISGCSSGGAGYAFDDGRFMGTPVYLGELRTDSEGRLLFLGGHGVSAAYDGRPVYTFANNDGWHDDVSDGPVTATVRIGDAQLPVSPAWVVCAPPNYGPDFKSIVTLHELLTQTMIQAGFLAAPARPSFPTHILPLLARTNALQWVNLGFLSQFADQGPQDFLRPPVLERLASRAPENAELRRQVCNAFRNPDYGDRQRLALPWIYGDGMALPADSNRQWMAVPPYLYQMLGQWADGDFDEAPSPQTETDPQRLDRAALEYCLADAFHPGCEVTWPIRHASMFMSPYRLLHRSPADPEPEYGDELKPAQVYSGGWSSSTAVYGAGTPGGPLWGQRPGDLTRWMAVPWQTDTASCRDGYDASYDEYVPTFWPARVPNQVLDREGYERVLDRGLPDAARLAAFRTREEWLRPFSGGYLDQVRQMVDGFSKLGVVEQRPGPEDAAELGVPEAFFVEVLPQQLPAPPGDASANIRQAKAELHATQKAVSKARRRRREP
jgi:hypothetical protein